MKTRKIQFDTFYGVQSVKEFDSEIDIISQEDVFYYLRTAEVGVIYGCEVDEETFAKIEEEYGIQ